MTPGRQRERRPIRVGTAVAVIVAVAAAAIVGLLWVSGELHPPVGVTAPYDDESLSDRATRERQAADALAHRPISAPFPAALPDDLDVIAETLVATQEVDGGWILLYSVGDPAEATRSAVSAFEAAGYVLTGSEPAVLSSGPITITIRVPAMSQSSGARLAVTIVGAPETPAR